MFEPMPAMMRRERERQGLTLEELSGLAGVSRSRLSALERGEENVSFEFVLKVANALGMTELRVGGLRVTAAPPPLTLLSAAADALEASRAIVDHALESRENLDRVQADIAALLDRVMHPVADPGISQVVERLRGADPGTSASALRELADSLDLPVRALRTKREPKAGRETRRREPKS